MRSPSSTQNAKHFSPKRPRHAPRAHRIGSRSLAFTLRPQAWSRVPATGPARRSLCCRLPRSLRPPHRRSRWDLPPPARHGRRSPRPHASETRLPRLAPRSKPGSARAGACHCSHPSSDHQLLGAGKRFDCKLARARRTRSRCGEPDRSKGHEKNFSVRCQASFRRRRYAPSAASSQHRGVTETCRSVNVVPSSAPCTCTLTRNNRRSSVEEERI